MTIPCTMSCRSTKGLRTGLETGVEGGPRRRPLQVDGQPRPLVPRRLRLPVQSSDPQHQSDSLPQTGRPSRDGCRPGTLPWLGFVPRREAARASRTTAACGAAATSSDPDHIRSYGKRANTRTGHLRSVARYLGWRMPTPLDLNRMFLREGSHADWVTVARLADRTRSSGENSSIATRRTAAARRARSSSTGGLSAGSVVT